ncbi:MAG: hypothetical protein VX663_08435 [Pseudomonadota bacterium]|nr:hypothetical protein [Pseudomonadota bacterium]
MIQSSPVRIIRRALLAAGIFCNSTSAETAAIPPGQSLYENHCTGCHESVVHVRSERKARDYQEIRDWVVRWAGAQELDWTGAEVDAVANYLNQSYYGF